LPIRIQNPAFQKKEEKMKKNKVFTKLTTTAEKGRETGLGFSLPRASSRLMAQGMRRECNSAGKGATFTFTLPLAEP
jgi:signal transduction histidine kinase